MFRTMSDAACRESAMTMAKLIGTQSRRTLIEWTCDYAEKNFLTVLSRPNADGFVKCLRAARKHMNGEINNKQMKVYISSAKNMTEGIFDGMEKKAAFAIVMACRTSMTPASALGFCLYGALVKCVLDESKFDELFDAEISKMYDSLKSVSSVGESKPAKIRWKFF